MSVTPHNNILHACRTSVHEDTCALLLTACDEAESQFFRGDARRSSCTFLLSQLGAFSDLDNVSSRPG
jgi:hypothetical protein